MPVIFPPHGNHPIAQGSIDDPCVCAYINNYHPFGEAWTWAVKTASLRQTLCQFVVTDVAADLPDLSPAGSFVQDINVNPGANERLIARIESAMRINTETYYQFHPKERLDKPYFIIPPASLDGLGELGMDDPTEELSSAAMKKIKLKIESITLALKLFFAFFDVQEDSVTALALNQALVSLHEKSTTFSTFVSQHRRALEVYFKEQVKHRDYLHRSMEMPPAGYNNYQIP